ncbi:hypothetical protein CDIK_0001 [Cucumispora dikerogammari]|nr:hypothetical protein CDIK_0001 [Cucumispora dikerogammari]
MSNTNKTQESSTETNTDNSNTKERVGKAQNKTRSNAGEIRNRSNKDNDQETNKDKNIKPEVSVLNPTEYLNTHCQNKDEYELNSMLANLNKEIALLKTDQKSLISNNFNKFLLCKNTIQKIENEGILKNTNINEIIKEANHIKENFLKIIADAKINLEEEKRKRERDHLINKYSHIFNGGVVLKKYFKERDFDNFIEYFKKAKKEYKELKESKYIKILWKEILFYKNSICEELALEIENKNKSKEEILYYFYVYFQLKGNKHRNKIGNTLLTFLKVFLHNSRENVALIEIDEILSYCYKLIIMLDDFFMKNLMIKELFSSLKFLVEKFNKENIIIYNIFLIKIKEFYNKIKQENMLSLSFIEEYKKLESLVCKNYLKNEKNLNLKIKKALPVFNKSLVKEQVQNILIDFIQYRPPAIRYLEKINKLQNKIGEINDILKTFNETLDYDFMKEFDDKILKEEIRCFADLNVVDGRDEEVLMLAVKLKNKIPISFPKLVLVKKEVFLKNNILRFFLQKYVPNYKPVEVEQNEEFREAYKSFGFLIG